jgi:hypothetical protein
MANIEQLQTKKSRSKRYGKKIAGFRLQVSGQVSRTIVRPFRVAMPRLFT